MLDEICAKLMAAIVICFCLIISFATFISMQKINGEYTCQSKNDQASIIHSMKPKEYTCY